jgi:hypothetical protein
MTDKQKRKIRKSVAEMMCLEMQVKTLADFAPINYSMGNTGSTIQVYDNKSFEDVREAFDILESDIKKSWSSDGRVFHKYMPLGRGFELSVCLWENEEGYEESANE